LRPKGRARVPENSFHFQNQRVRLIAAKVPAKLFLKKALANAENRPPLVFARDALRSYPAALWELQAEGRVARHCRQCTRRYCNNRIESDHRHVKRRLRAMQGPLATTTAWAVIQGIEAAYMIRRGQGLGITHCNLYGQAWLFGALLGVRSSAKFTPGARGLVFSTQMQHYATSRKLTDGATWIADTHHATPRRAGAASGRANEARLASVRRFAVHWMRRPEKQNATDRKSKPQQGAAGLAGENV
jgi:hypothetical protein